MKALLFDIDGVINKGDYFSKNYEKDFGVSRAVISIFFKGDFLNCSIGKTDLKEALLPYLKTWNWPGDADALLDYWFEHDVKLDWPLIEFIQSLRKQGYYCALASQQEKYRKQHLWDTAGLQHQFEDFFCTCDIGVIKKDVAFFHAIIDHLKKNKIITSADEIVFWDDTEAVIDTAHDAGIANAFLFTENRDITEYSFFTS